MYVDSRLHKGKMYTLEEVKSLIRIEVCNEREVKRIQYRTVYRNMIEADVSVDIIANAFKEHDFYGNREQIEKDKAEYWAKKIKETPYLAHYLDE